MKHTQVSGIIAGVLAGVFWGTPFIAPIVLPGFTALQVTFGRFFFFALVSILFFPRIWRAFRAFSVGDVWQILFLSASGFWLYTLLLFYGIHLSNSIVAALVIGCLPLTITLFGKPRFNTQLCLGLVLIVIGLASLLVFPLLHSHQSLALRHFNPVGLLAILMALILWTWFAIKNAHFMSSHLNVSALDYSSMLGIISFVCILPFFILSGGLHAVMSSPHVGTYLFWSLILGLGASWIANILWAYSAKVCPPAIGGPLIVSETLFALLYSFILEKRPPFPNEFVATLALVVGVVLSIRSQGRALSEVVEAEGFDQAGEQATDQAEELL